MAQQNTSEAIPNNNDVLIIGGGPTGLTMSALFSRAGIRSLVVEKRKTLPADPQAHVIRRRSMEIFEQIGVADAVRAAEPDLALDYITWCSTLGGEEAGRLDLHIDENGDPLPKIWTNIPQNLLQPILFDRVQSDANCDVRLGTECVGIEDLDDGVTAKISLAGGDEHTVCARYAIVADGAGSPTRERLGIGMEGRGPGAKFYMIHFKADVTPWIKSRSGPLFWILNPAALGTFIVHDPKKSIVFMTPALADEEGEDQLRPRLMAALNIPIDPEIVSIRPWVAHGQIAERYRLGNAFLVGDAAHRFPPTGGLGLNTGIQEAHNLAWKLALVLKGRGADRLLDTYEPECKPAAQANAQDSMDNQEKLGRVFEAIGRVQDVDALDERLRSIDGAEKRALKDAIECQRSHFSQRT
jgi:2,4-dichlorophenol 6-monooxygenase